MNVDLLISKIFAEIKKADSLEPFKDMLDLCLNIAETDFDLAHKTNKELRLELSKAISRGENVTELFPLYKQSLFFDAPFFFEEYLLYNEIDRKPSERFYQPRRKVLKEVVDAIQELLDDELDELFVSMPPRVGKTTLLMFVVTFLVGRNSEKSNLYSAYSDTITKKFYDGVLEVLNDPITYHWNEVFPNAKIVKTDAADETINVDRKKRYPSLTCRSLYGTLNGACDCSGWEINDDLIGGIEEAMNKDRLDSAWSKVDNNLIPRAKENAKLFWCGTRWSLADPIGRRIDLLENDERFKKRRYKIITLPALDENDESLFDYDYGVGFSTDYYQQRRASFERNNDMASWAAQYMGEPIEREGALFTPDGFEYYNGVLPSEEPDRVFMPVDPAYGGGDYVASPVLVQYGDKIYVHDVVFDNHDKKVTQPLLVNAAIKYGATAMRIEATKSTEGYKDGVQELFNKEGYRINLTTKAASSQTSKQDRIYDRAPDIRDMMIFREPGKRSKEYSLFMQNVFSFKIIGKNKNDDAPDSLAMGIDMVVSPTRKAGTFVRKF